MPSTHHVYVVLLDHQHQITQLKMTLPSQASQNLINASASSSQSDHNFSTSQTADHDLTSLFGDINSASITVSLPPADTKTVVETRHFYDDSAATTLNLVHRINIDGSSRTQSDQPCSTCKHADDISTQIPLTFSLTLRKAVSSVADVPPEYCLHFAASDDPLHSDDHFQLSGDSTTSQLATVTAGTEEILRLVLARVVQRMTEDQATPSVHASGVAQSGHEAAGHQICDSHSREDSIYLMHDSFTNHVDRSGPRELVSTTESQETDHESDLTEVDLPLSYFERLPISDAPTPLINAEFAAHPQLVHVRNNLAAQGLTAPLQYRVHELRGEVVLVNAKERRRRWEENMALYRVESSPLCWLTSAGESESESDSGSDVEAETDSSSDTEV